LKRFFPSISQGLGAGNLNREAAMHFVERLEEESTRFYHVLATRAPDDDSRGFFTKEAEGEESQLKHNREVLL
jgi:rubrerythrin